MTKLTDNVQKVMNTLGSIGLGLVLAISSTLVNPAELEARSIRNPLRIRMRNGQISIGYKTRDFKARLILDGRNNKVRGRFRDRDGIDIDLEPKLNRSRIRYNASTASKEVRTLVHNYNRMGMYVRVRTRRKRIAGADYLTSTMFYDLNRDGKADEKSSFTLRIPYGTQADSGEISSFIAAHQSKLNKWYTQHQKFQIEHENKKQLLRKQRERIKQERNAKHKKQLESRLNKVPHVQKRKFKWY